MLWSSMLDPLDQGSSPSHSSRVSLVGVWSGGGGWAEGKTKLGGAFRSAET